MLTENTWRSLTGFASGLLLGACATAKPQLSNEPPQSAAEFARSLSLTAGPRPTGSAGDRRAQAWAMLAMQQIGLANVHLEKVAALVWERGTESVEWKGVGALKATALGRSGATGPAGVEGEVVMVASVEEAEQLAAEKVSGKVLFIYAPTERTKDGSGYGKGVNPRRSGGFVGEKLGAIGVVIRSVSTSEDEFPHTGASRPSKIPSFALAPLDAARLAKAAATGATRLKLVSTAKSYPGESANVVGEWVGTGQASEIILLGAHLDSWDLGQGALDDASGVGAVLEAMRRLRQTPLRRTVRVVLFANEENGLAGAEAYAKAHQSEINAHILVLEADSGCGEIEGIEWNAGAEAEETLKTWLKESLAKGHWFKQKPISGGSDLTPLVAQGVPTLEFAQDRMSYFDYHHSARDTVEALNATTLQALSEAFVSVTLAAAQSESRLGSAQKPTR
jgi:carboxypeptidase Q